MRAQDQDFRGAMVFTGARLPRDLLSLMQTAGLLFLAVAAVNTWEGTQQVTA